MIALTDTKHLKHEKYHKLLLLIRSLLIEIKSYYVKYSKSCTHKPSKVTNLEGGGRGDQDGEHM